jgi:hypothetical protein
MFLIHIYDDRARILARLVLDAPPDLDELRELMTREYPTCSFNIAPKHKEQQNEDTHRPRIT